MDNSMFLRASILCYFLINKINYLPNLKSVYFLFIEIKKKDIFVMIPKINTCMSLAIFLSLKIPITVIHLKNPFPFNKFNQSTSLSRFLNSLLLETNDISCIEPTSPSPAIETPTMPPTSHDSRGLVSCMSLS